MGGESRLGQQFIDVRSLRSRLMTNLAAMHRLILRTDHASEFFLFAGLPYEPLFV